MYGSQKKTQAATSNPVTHNFLLYKVTSVHMSSNVFHMSAHVSQTTTKDLTL